MKSFELRTNKGGCVEITEELTKYNKATNTLLPNRRYVISLDLIVSESEPPEGYRLVTEDEKHKFVIPKGAILWQSSEGEWRFVEDFAIAGRTFLKQYSYAVPVNHVFEHTEDDSHPPKGYRPVTADEKYRFRIPECAMLWSPLHGGWIHIVEAGLPFLYRCFYAVPNGHVFAEDFIVTLNGKEIDPKDISEETWNNLRRKHD